MEPIDRHPDDALRDAADTALDEVLRQARWPEPSEASTRRLEAAWARVSPARDGWSIRPWVAAAAAAVLVLAVAVAAVVVSRGGDRPGVVTHVPPVQPDIPAPRPPPRVAPAVAVVWHEPVREPNAWERAVLCVERRRPAKPAKRETPVGAGASDAAVSPLFDALSDPRVATRIDAARALGRLNRPDVTAQLVARVEGDVGRREALAALLCSPGADAAAYVNAARESPALRGTVRSVELQLAHY